MVEEDTISIIKTKIDLILLKNQFNQFILLAYF